MDTIKSFYRNIVNKPYSFDILASLGLIAVSLYIHGFLLAKDLSQYVNDASRYNGFQALLIKYSLENFQQFGIWDHLLSGGRSWISDPAGPHFSPFTWPIIALSGDVYDVTRLLIISHAVIAPLAFYFFLRVIKLSRVTAFLFAVPFIANRYAITFGINGWLEEYYGFYLLPLSAAFSWLAITTRKTRYAVLCGLVLALHFFENTFYVFHYNLITILWLSALFAFSILFQILSASKEVRHKARHTYAKLPARLLGRFRLQESISAILHFLKANVVMVLVLVGIAAIKVMPLLEFRTISARKEVPLSVVEAPGEVETFQFLWERFFNTIAERVGSSTLHTSYISQFANYVLLLFVGIAVLYFIIKRKFIYGVFVSMLFMAVWAYFANRLPLDLYAVYYYLIPGFNSNRLPFRFFIIIHFAFFVLAALGFNLLWNQKKLYTVKYVAVFAAIVMAIGASVYTRNVYIGLHTRMQPRHPIIELLKKPPTFTIASNADYQIPPQVVGDAGKSLLYLLTHLIKEYHPEGRVYANYSNYDDAINPPVAITTRIPSLLYSYEAQLPTYQYHLVNTSVDSLTTVRKRYKLLSIYNIRFHEQGKENFEFTGCESLVLPKSDESTGEEKPQVAPDICAFLQSRLVPLHRTTKGGIYYDTQVIQKLATLNNAILVISDNRMQDYSSFIAKQLLFHAVFDIHNTTIFTDAGKSVDQYTLAELQQFAAIILIDSNTNDLQKADKTLQAYQTQGGKRLDLTGIWRQYENLQKRSDSIFTDQPAWQYRSEDAFALEQLFTSLQSPYEKPALRVDLYTPEKVIIHVATIKQNTPFQFSDSFFPGWKAKIDGKEVPVYMADGLVKGVLITNPGEHRIEMYYRPDSLLLGSIITVSTVLVLAGTGLFAKFRNTRRKR